MPENRNTFLNNPLSHKWNLKLKLFISIYLYLFPLISISSQPDSLFVYLNLAAERNPLLRQKYTEYRAAIEKVPQASSLSDPQLDMGFFVTPMELLGGKQYADLKLMQMFPWFGTLKASKDEASKMALAKMEAWFDARLQVFFEVKKNWYELNMKAESAGILEKNLSILQSIEQTALAKYRSGGSPDQQMQPGSMNIPETGLADIYRIQIDELELKNEIARLRDSEKTSLAKFNGYIGRDPQMKVTLPDTMRADTLIIPLSALRDSIFSSNPMLLMSKYEQQALDARKKMVSLMGYPMAGVGLNYSVIGKSSMSSSSMNGKDMLMPMVSLTLPIYRKKYTAMKKEAEYLKQASEKGYREAERSLQSEYAEAVEAYSDAGRRIDLYSAQSELSRKALNVMIKSYSASSASLRDLLMASADLREYEMKLVGAVADRNMSAAMLRKLMAYCEIINNQIIK